MPSGTLSDALAMTAASCGVVPGRAADVHVGRGHPAAPALVQRLEHGRDDLRLGHPVQLHPGQRGAPAADG